VLTISPLIIDCSASRNLGKMNAMLFLHYLKNILVEVSRPAVYALTFGILTAAISFEKSSFGHPGITPLEVLQCKGSSSLICR